MITHKKLLELVSYDPTTGLFTVRKATPRRQPGTVMNINVLRVIRPGATPVRRTYISIWKNGHFFAAPLAWFYMTGKWSGPEVDHVDNDGWNQKWENFRQASRSQNQANTRIYKTNTSGMKCVFRSGGKKKPWRVTIQKDKRRISIGRFETKEEAHAAYMAAAALYHGEFMRAA